MTTGNDPPKLTPEEHAELLAWLPSQEQADAIFSWTLEKGIAAVCMKKIQRIEQELYELKQELAKI